MGSGGGAELGHPMSPPCSLACRPQCHKLLAVTAILQDLLCRGGESWAQGRGWENSREEVPGGAALGASWSPVISVGHPASQRSQGKALGCLEPAGTSPCHLLNERRWGAGGGSSPELTV